MEKEIVDSFSMQDIEDDSLYIDREFMEKIFIGHATTKEDKADYLKGIEGQEHVQVIHLMGWLGY